MNLKEVLSIEEPMKMLNELVAYGNLTGSAARDFDALPPIAQMIVLIRAFYIHMLGCDFGEFLCDTTCGDKVEELKTCLKRIDSQGALEFVEIVESQFPGKVIPKDALERWEALQSIEGRLGGAWLVDLSKGHLGNAVTSVDLLRQFLIRNQDLVDHAIPSEKRN
ncbi:MAG: hypothetical protein ACK4UN_10020 [Limisphaerales bacterium]